MRRRGGPREKGGSAFFSTSTSLLQLFAWPGRTPHPLSCCTTQGILDARGRHTLAQTAYHAFMPALCFTSLARAADAASLAAWSPLLWNMGAAIGVGWAVGWGTQAVARPPAALTGHVIAAAGFGNVANLLLVLSGGLCRGPAARAALLPPHSPAAASSDACEALGAAYVMTPVLVATLAQLLAVESLLRRDREPGWAAAAALPPSSPPAAELVPLAADGMERGGGGGGGGGGGYPPATTASTSRHASPAKAAAARAAALAGTPSGVGLPTTAAPAATTSTSPLSRAWATVRFFGSGLARPPSAATLAGIAVGCSPPLKAALFSPAGAPAAAAPPLAALTAALATLGEAMVPVILVGLGAELAGEAEGEGGGEGGEVDDDPPTAPPLLPARVYAATAAARLILMPLLGLAVLAVARRAGLYKPLDGLFDVVAHLAWATPAAAILVLIAGRERNQPRAMARLLLASYAGSAVTLPVFMAGLLRWVVVKQ